MDKRFKIPKKFLNTDLPKNPSNTGTAYTFAKVYYSSTGTYLSSATTITNMIAWPINVNTEAISPSYYSTHLYQTNLKASALSGYIWGYSYSRMNYLSDIYIYKSSTLSGLKLT